MERISRLPSCSSSRACAINRRACAIVKAGFFFEHQTQSHQKQVCHERMRHMMMPTHPTARFVMIHSNLAFAFFQRGLDRPAQSAHPDEFRARAGCRRIAQIELQLGFFPTTATEDNPDPWTGQPRADRGHTQERKVSHQGTFTPFFDAMACPRRLG